MKACKSLTAVLHPLEEFYLSFVAHDQLPVVFEVECEVVMKSSRPRSFVIVQ
jgi:hypothetical protein